MSESVDAGADVAAFGGTVFISYARNDDQKPPDDDTVPGWVTFFWQQLRFELTNAGVPEADLWLDRYEIEPSEDFTKKIEAALDDAELVLVVLSPNWIKRPACLKEVSYFAELHPDAADKTVIVKKLELPPGVNIPPIVNRIFENREGYRFFEKDPSGNIKEFYWRGLKYQKAYYDLLLKIARWIASQMISREAPRSPQPAPSKGKAIYLSAPADDLRDAWQRLANDLEGAGYEVLPAADRLPDTAQAAETAVRDALAKAVLSVHFLGDSEGVKPDRSDETVARLQLRLARERGAATRTFTRILWAPKWLTDRTKGKRDPFQVVQRFGPLLPGEEVYAEEVTDLSQWLRGRLDREEENAKFGATSNKDTRPPPPEPRTLLVVSADPEDDELVTPLANRLQSTEIKVHVAFAGDPPVIDASAAIVMWGKADQSKISARLATLEPLKPIVLWLPGGDEAVKRRFFREGVYSERLDTLPADRKSGRDLLMRLEILPSNGNYGA
jgi:TIR domain